jgi:hypothetical protein
MNDLASRVSSGHLRQQRRWSLVCGGLALVLAALVLDRSCAAAASPWPGESWSAATDLTSLAPAAWASNLSGAFWDPAARRLWVCTNNPARFWSLKENGAGGFAIEREYTGTGDLEAITCIANLPDRVFLLDEQARTIRSYRVSDGAALTTWFLASIPDWGNSGPEGLALVPDEWLAKDRFVDATGALRPGSVLGTDGFGGLMFVAVQTAGWVYAFDLRNDGTFTTVGRYATSRTESCELTFDPSTGRLFVLHNTGSNYLEVTDLTSSAVSGSDRRFTSLAEFAVPSTSNIEGLALTPAWNANDAPGDGWCFFTDDDAQSGALRWFHQLHARIDRVAGDGQTAAAGTAVPVPPAVRVTDAFADRVPGVSTTFTVTGGGGTVSEGDAVTDSSGVARVGAWVLGATPGANTLTATRAGLTGSPLDFTANGEEAAAVDEGALGSSTVRLGPPTPNPGPGHLRITFTLPRELAVELAVHDVRGRCVRTLTSGIRAPGVHEVDWDGADASGAPVAPGVYFFQLRAGATRLARSARIVR